MMMKPFGSTVAMSMGGTFIPFPTSTPQWKCDVFPSFRGDDARKGFTASCTYPYHSTRPWKPEAFSSFRGDYTRKRFRASCASFPPSTPQWKYDVFLSFRGEDTRKGFTDHLYAALDRKRIVTFRDDRELQKGKSISPELRTAIEESRFALIVLSENFASSTWCLDELLHILECMEARNAVLPIFYGVDPSVVRKQTGRFAEAFSTHEKKKVRSWRYALTKVANFWGWDAFGTHEKNLGVYEKKVRSWRRALTTVANSGGWNSKGRSEAELVKDIVQVVWKKLRPTLLCHVGDLVAIDSRSKPIIDLCSDATGNDGCFVGIWGMGGIGKTTVARVVCERISHEFEFKIFLADVRSNVEKFGLPYLQKELLRQIGMEKNNIGKDVQEGAAIICRFLVGKKVLLVLDDVNDLQHLKSLAGNQEWFGLGSRVLITTRDERLLVLHGVERRFEVKGLNNDDSLLLFSWNAFKQDWPEPDFVDLSNRVVNYAKGLPLALKVLGSLLYRRGSREWNSTLDKLKEVRNSKFFETLKISYDGLDDDDERKIFLDIACFFSGEAKGRVSEVLEACGRYAYIGIEVLVEKSLLTINSVGELSMHDLLQEMGREIVRRESFDDPGKRSRLWHRDDINRVLSENTGTETIECISMPLSGRGTVQVNAKSFSMMKNLRYLRLEYADHCNGPEYLPSSLRFLEWPSFPLKILPSSFSPEHLVELHMMYSDLEHLWKGIKHSYNLKFLNLAYSRNVETPDFSGMPNLENLILKCCGQSYEVGQSVGRLNDIGCLSSLRQLDLSLNPFSGLPMSICQLSKLEYLDVSNCSRLHALPELPSTISCVLAYNCYALESARVDVIKLFANCFKRVEKQVCVSTIFPPVLGCMFVVPGREIPECFSHRSVGSSISVELHPGWSTDHKLKGFAVCGGVFESFRYLDSLKLSINGETCIRFVRKYEFLVRGHLLFFFLPRHEFFTGNEWQNISELKFSFEHEYLTIQKVMYAGIGMCFVYEEDVEAVI